MAPFFEVLKSINQTKKPWKSLTEEEQKSINPFMLHKYISLNNDYLDITNEIQELNIQSPEKLYRIYVNLLPVDKRFHKYIKSNVEKINEEHIGYIAKYFECSLDNAKDYHILINEEQIEQIIQQLGINGKIKKSKTRIIKEKKTKNKKIS